MKTASNFAKYAFGVLIYNLFVIAWGVAVRATGSGDGCGQNWPNCDGAVIPIFHDAATFLEYGHRVSTMISGLLVLGMMAWAIVGFPKGHIVRKASAATLFFLILEALIGRELVMKGYVVHDTSAMRVFWLSVHLLNTLVFIGCIAAVVFWASGHATPKFKGQGAIGWAIGAAILGMFVLGVSGAMSALGDTLFPSDGLLNGIKQDFTPGVHFLVSLRPLHPLIATSVALYMILLAGLLVKFRPSEHVTRGSKWVVGLVIVQMAIGVVNLLLQAPLVMQLLHLLGADLMWLAFLYLSMSALASNVQHTEEFTEDQEQAPELHGMDLVKAYVALTKPRVISLLLFTTLTAMIMAAGGWPGVTLFSIVAIGGYMAAGAANAINMVIDRDIDRTMKRTSKRPTVTSAIPATNALMFGFGLAALSFVLLWLGANLLCAIMALAGLVFYVIVYTLMLKRRTWHNIVIGGAAGSFPPMVGWAAVTNDLSAFAWILFALIFVWTPVHFWALALMIKDDYAKAGVPMLPVVRGERVTVIQIMMYAVLTAIISILPMFMKNVGLLYVGVAVLLNVGLFVKCIGLFKTTERPQALSLYKFSMTYLFALFLTLAIDRIGGW
ncbi:MAG: heme o synthase [Fimbriimonadaceae bacterium]|nr:heme o synthase [Fimbriimonadaceae bacterium]